jgi:hypothetical protein
MKPLRIPLLGIVFAALLFMPGITLLTDESNSRSGGSASAQETVDVSYFYDELADYGPWVWHPRFGYVWLPQDVSDDWRPYSVGQWFYTNEHGWYWHSDEPFAWAVYHYGRWGYDPDYGWFWVPGDVWAPAWVTWRYSDRYAGWAPIAPHRPGYAYGVPAVYEPTVAEAWVFVEPEYLVVEDVYEYAVPVEEIDVVFLQTTTIYHPELHGNVIYNAGIPYGHLEGILNRPVPTYRVVEVQERNAARAWSRGDKELPIFAPRLNKAAPHRPPRQFAQTPFEANPKAKIKSAVRKTAKGMGPSVSRLEPIAKKVGPSRFDPRGKGVGRPRDFSRDHDWERGPKAADRDRDWDRGPKAAKERDHQGGPKAANKDRDWDRGPKAKERDHQGGPKAADKDRDWDRDWDGGSKDAAKERDHQGGPKAANKDRDWDRGPKAAKERYHQGGPKAADKDRDWDRDWDGGSKDAAKERDHQGGPKAANNDRDWDRGPKAAKERYHQGGPKAADKDRDWDRGPKAAKERDRGPKAANRDGDREPKAAAKRDGGNGPGKKKKKDEEKEGG